MKSIESQPRVNVAWRTIAAVSAPLMVLGLAGCEKDSTAAHKSNETHAKYSVNGDQCYTWSKDEVTRAPVGADGSCPPNLGLETTNPDSQIKYKKMGEMCIGVGKDEHSEQHLEPGWSCPPDLPK